MPKFEAPVAAFTDMLSDVLSATRRVYEACLRLEQLDRKDALPKAARNYYWEPLRTMGDPDLEERVAAEDEALLAKLEKGVKGKPWGSAVASAVRATREFRDRIDKARGALPPLAKIMDDAKKAGPDRWTVKADGELRRLRGAIVLKQPRDIDPSDMPWVGVGVPEALQEAARPIVARMEELKSVGFLGAVPITSNPSEKIKHHPPADQKTSRPIPTAAAAKELNTRSDLLLKKLRSRGYRLTGKPRAYFADLEDICRAYPRRAKRLREWANEKFPA